MIYFICEYKLRKKVDVMKRGNISIYESSLLSHWFEVIRCYAINYNFYEMKPHRHNEMEIMYAVHGTCKIICWNNSLSKEEYTLKEGEYIFLDCNTPHQLEVAKDDSCRILNLEMALTKQDNGFQLSRFYEVANSIKEFLKLPSHAFKCNDNGGSLHRTIVEIQKQLRNSVDQIEQHIEVNLLLAQLLIEISRQRIKRHSAVSGSIYVKRAYSYIESNFDRDITVEEIAIAIGISTAYLQRLFKEQIGCTLIDKINELRIEKSKMLLETSCLPMIDIACTVGFNNRQHYSYTFTKIVGCSPALYRKRKGNNQLWVGY